MLSPSCMTRRSRSALHSLARQSSDRGLAFARPRPICCQSSDLTPTYRGSSTHAATRRTGFCLHPLPRSRWPRFVTAPPCHPVFNPSRSPDSASRPRLIIDNRVTDYRQLPRPTFRRKPLVDYAIPTASIPRRPPAWVAKVYSPTRFVSRHMGEPLYQIIGRHRAEPLPERKPSWLKVRAPGGPNYLRLKQLMRELDLHTVCEEAHCPNVGECWEHGTATFMILGDVCTRNCAYCAVAHGRPPTYDIEEPSRVAEAIAEMQLQHAVITSVDRDDLPDFGAYIFAETIRRIKQRLPDCSVEVLVPDFQGNEDSIRSVLEAGPDIYNHNTETVPRLYKRCRPGGRYERVMQIFRTAKRIAPHIPTKTGIILGMGETLEEVEIVMRDLRAVDVDILTLGQYLRPSESHHPIDRYVTPDEFRRMREIGMAMGFRHVESGPLVRSSYHAWEQVQAAGV